ncbi:hypothetical protein M3194_23620 [Paenibacillus glycanilyticus]|uniref:hypothetical protein n=1 Tax=Paenibacillus glycanilyticus TaxID=126569 RepID=UPI00203B6D4C|nr:hypothetical protein [Paenibacillus glycanilyticus]MCM3630325.1 hypothetical protein [Paenibacillus glycanilyticus]
MAALKLTSYLAGTHRWAAPRATLADSGLKLTNNLNLADTQPRLRGGTSKKATG